MATLLKRFGDAGLKDLIIETGLIGEDTTEKLLKGKHYNNAMRIHHYVAEAITRIKLDAFQDWLRSNGKYQVYESAVHADEINFLDTTRNSANMRSCMERLQELFNLYEEFDETISDHERFPMAVFWNSYLDMVQTLRDFTKSIKLGDWDLHMHSSEKMLRWYHGYDHYNYARHFSYYWASQQSLSVTHPTIYNWFKDGGFSTRRSPGKFNKVSPDQVIEQTVNKDQKGPGNFYRFKLSYIHSIQALCHDMNNPMKNIHLFKLSLKINQTKRHVYTFRDRCNYVLYFLHSNFKSLLS